MIAMTSVEAQSRFGELIDRSQREPVEVTRRGRTVAYVVCEQDMKELVDVRRRREAAAQWYAQYRQKQVTTPEAASLTEAEVNELVHALRS